MGNLAHNHSSQNTSYTINGIFREFNRAIVNSLNEYEFLHTICEIIPANSVVNTCWITLFENGESLFTETVAQSDLVAKWNTNYIFSIVYTIFKQQNMQTGGTQVAPYITLTFPDDFPRLQALDEEPSGNLVALPICVNEVYIGFLHLYFSNYSPIHDEMRNIFVELTQFLSHGLEWYRTRKKLGDTNQQLQTEQGLLEKIFDLVPIMFVIYDKDGKFLKLNRELTRVLGWTMEDARKHDLMELCYPDPAKRRETWEFMASLEEGWREFSVTAKDGSTVISDWSNISLEDGRAIGVGIDLREQKKHMQEMESSYQKLKSLSTHMQHVREEERKTLARNLHDEIGGSYVRLKLDLLKLQRSIEPGTDIDSYEQQFSVMNQLIDSALERVRNVINELRPVALEERNFLDSVQIYLGNFGKRYNLKCRFTHHISSRLTFSEEVTLALFRILQEALLNIARHAQTQEVIVRLKRENSTFILNIIDNGKGFIPDDLQDGSFGILGMQERAEIFQGTVTIDSQPDQGTIVQVEIPLNSIEIIEQDA